MPQTRGHIRYFRHFLQFSNLTEYGVPIQRSRRWGVVVLTLTLVLVDYLFFATSSVLIPSFILFLLMFSEQIFFELVTLFSLIIWKKAN